MKLSALIHTLLTLSFICSCTNNSNTKEDDSQIIVTKALMQVTPEQVAAFKKVSATVAKQSLNEEGCLSYAFYQSATDSTQFFLYEEYTNQAALDAHLAKPYLTDFRKARKHMIVGEIPYTIFQAKIKHSTAISPKSIEVKIPPLTKP